MQAINFSLVGFDHFKFETINHRNFMTRGHMPKRMDYQAADSIELFIAALRSKVSIELVNGGERIH